MRSSHLQQRIDRISRDLLDAWMDDRANARTRRPHVPDSALRNVARANGWQEEVPLKTWLANNAKPHQSIRLDPSMERITTSLLTEWMKHRKAGDMRQMRELSTALQDIACAHARCEGKPLGFWMLEQVRVPKIQERKAVSEALSTMVFPGLDCDELLPALFEQLKDSNRFIRARAAAVLARMRRTDNSAQIIVDKLAECLRECANAEGHLTDNLRNGPLSRDDLHTHLEDFQQNAPDDFAWAAAASAVIKISGVSASPKVVEALLEGLSSGVWLVRAVSAEALRKIRGISYAFAKIDEQLRSHDRTMWRDGIHRIGSIAMQVKLPTEALNLLLKANEDGDLLMRATAIESIGLAGRADIGMRSKAMAELKAILNGPCSLLNNIANKVLELILTTSSQLPQLLCAMPEDGDDAQWLDSSRRFDLAGEVLSYLRGSPDLSEARTRNLPGREEQPTGQPACLLYIDLCKHENSELEQAVLSSRMHRLEETIRSTQAWTNALPGVDLMPDGSGYAVIFHKNATQAVECAIEMSRSMLQKSLLAVRMGLYTGGILQVVRRKGAAWELLGNAISTAGDIAAQGQPGQILLSESVAVATHSSKWSAYYTKVGKATVIGETNLALYNLADPSNRFGSSSIPAAVVEFKAMDGWAKSRRALTAVISLLKYAYVVGLLALIGLVTYRYLIPAILVKPQLPAKTPFKQLPGLPAQTREPVKQTVSRPPNSPIQYNSTRPEPEVKTGSAQEDQPTEPVDTSITYAASVDGRTSNELGSVPGRPSKEAMQSEADGVYVDLEVTCDAVNRASLTAYDQFRNELPGANRSIQNPPYKWTVEARGDYVVAIFKLEMDDGTVKTETHAYSLK